MRVVTAVTAHQLAGVAGRAERRGEQGEVAVVAAVEDELGVLRRDRRCERRILRRRARTGGATGRTIRRVRGHRRAVVLGGGGELRGEARAVLARVVHHVHALQLELLHDVVGVSRPLHAVVRDHAEEVVEGVLEGSDQQRVRRRRADERHVRRAVDGLGILGRAGEGRTDNRERLHARHAERRLTRCLRLVTLVVQLLDREVEWVALLGVPLGDGELNGVDHVQAELRVAARERALVRDLVRRNGLVCLGRGAGERRPCNTGKHEAPDGERDPCLHEQLPHEVPSFLGGRRETHEECPPDLTVRS